MTSTRTRLAALTVAVAATVPAALAGATGTASANPGYLDKPGVVRDGNVWQLRGSLTTGGANTTFTYGSPDDEGPITGDWDGNGDTTPGIVRAGRDGRLVWYLSNFNTTGGAQISFTYGVVGDVVVVGDWDGNGTDTPGVLREVNGAPHWLLRNSNSPGAAQVDFAFGPSDFFPVVGDWNGDGIDTPGVVQAAGTALRWRTRDANSAGAANRDFQYGQSVTDDLPIIGDWDGDGTDGIGVTRPVAGLWQWKLRPTATAGAAAYTFNYGSDYTEPVVWS